MESREVMVVGLWMFAIISLIGGMMGRLDGFFIIIFFIVAVVISYGIVAMPKSKI